VDFLPGIPRNKKPSFAFCELDDVTLGSSAIFQFRKNREFEEIN
jgi:hypothetical protein